MKSATAHKFTVVALLALSLDSCGRETSMSSHGSTVSSPASIDGEPIKARLFYNFALTTHSEKFVKDVHGPRDDPEAGWKYSVGRNSDPSNDFGRAYTLVTYWDRDNYDYGQSTLNLETGEIYFHVIHSATGMMRAPKLGGDYYAYRNQLASIKGYLVLSRADPEVLTYVDKVLGSLENNQPVDTAQLNSGVGEIPVVLGASNTYEVSYHVNQERDILVDFMEQDVDPRTYATHYVWRAGGRSHTSSSASVANIDVVLPTSLKGQIVCAFTKLLPTGADYTKAVYESQTCLGQL